MFSLPSFGLALLTAGGLVLPRAAPVAHADDCRFVLGFATLHDMIPYNVGTCADNEGHNPENGDGLQHTVTPQGGPGLLVWRKADNFTAFTDGAHSWVNGPRGLEYRLNSQRFAWEANPDRLPIAADVYGGVSADGRYHPAPQSGTKFGVTNSPFGTGPGPLVIDIAGSGFVPGETITLQGTYTPAFLVRTGDPQTPATQQNCDTVPLGPLQVTANDSGAFTATLQGNTNLLLGGPNTITATGDRGSRGTLGSGGSLPLVDALPASCRA